MKVRYEMTTEHRYNKTMNRSKTGRVNHSDRFKKEMEKRQDMKRRAERLKRV